jgi:hypothetical protein
VCSLEEELEVIRAENEELEKLSSSEARRNRDLTREVESLRSNLSIEKGEVDNLMLKNQILQESNSRPTTPAKGTASPGSSIRYSFRRFYLLFSSSLAAICTLDLLITCQYV